MKSSNLLSELSPNDKKFRDHKFDSIKVANLLLEAGDSKHYSRMISCASNLSFRLTHEGYKLRQTFVYTSNGVKMPLIQFCKIRYCPICQWRRSKLWKHKFLVAIPRILEDFPNHQFLFLTLTVENPPLIEMRATLQKMSEAYRKMSRVYNKDDKRTRGNKNWPAIGHVRFTEVTRGDKPGCCHPHFHCLLLVPQSYFFKDNYMTKEQWWLMWQKYMKSDYAPSIGINVVRDDCTKIIPEIVKYACKNADLLDSKFLLVYKEQMKYYHLVEINGVLSDYINSSDVESEDENLINYAEEQSYLDTEKIVSFRWRQTDILLEEGNKLCDYQLVI